MYILWSNCLLRAKIRSLAPGNIQLSLPTPVTKKPLINVMAISGFLPVAVKRHAS